MQEAPIFSFDLDGTVFDTNGCFEDASIAAFGKHGIVLTSEEFREGARNGGSAIDWLLEKGFSRPDADKIVQERDSTMIEYLLSETKWMPGAPDMLDKIRSRQEKIVAVSNTTRKYLNPILSKLPEADSYFTHFVLRDTPGITRKPDPSGIYRAQEIYQCNPDRLIHLGDQEFDLLAARNAKVKACIYNGSHTDEATIRGADYVVERLSQVLDIKL